MIYLSNVFTTGMLSESLKQTQSTFTVKGEEIPIERVRQMVKEESIVSNFRSKAMLMAILNRLGRFQDLEKIHQNHQLFKLEPGDKLLIVDYEGPWINERTYHKVADGQLKCYSITIH